MLVNVLNLRGSDDDDDMDLEDEESSTVVQGLLLSCM